MNNKSTPYATREKVLLAQLVKENGVVENKRTDGATLAEKNKAWESITKIYNSQPEVNIPRTSEQLRKLWNNLKQRKRKETTALRYSMLATGGGPLKKATVDPVLQVVEDAAPNVDVNIMCPWDSTSLFEKDKCGSSFTREDMSFTEPFASMEHVEVVPALLLDAVMERDGTPQKELTEFSLPANNQVGLEPSLCTPTGITSARKNRAGSLKTEGNSRILKITEATRQQLELHNLRKRVVEEELLRTKEERDFMRKKAELELMKAKDEAELASLKLKEYKSGVG